MRERGWSCGASVFRRRHRVRIQSDFGGRDDAVGKIQHARATAGQFDFGARFGEVAQRFDDEAGKGVGAVQRQFQAELAV